MVTSTKGIFFTVIIMPGSTQTGPLFSNEPKRPNHKHRTEKQTSWDSLKPNFRQREWTEDFWEINAADLHSSSMWQLRMGGSLAAVSFNTGRRQMIDQKSVHVSCHICRTGATTDCRLNQPKGQNRYAKKSWNGLEKAGGLDLTWDLDRAVAVQVSALCRVSENSSFKHISTSFYYCKL